MKIVLLLSALLLSGAATAAERDVVAANGWGTFSCGQWTKSHQGKDPIAVSEQIGQGHWIFGYMSGFNMARIAEKKQVVELPDWNTVVAYMDGKCAAEPLQTILFQSIRLYGDLARMQGVKLPN